jgi:hypothetical protein
LLTTKELKNILHRKFARIDKILVVLAAIESPCEILDIRHRAQEAGLKTIGWNLSRMLADSKGKAIRTPEGWELTEDGLAHVRTLIGAEVEVKPPVAIDLRAQMAKIEDETTIAFVDEAVRCYESGVLRSAIVMSWLAAVDVLYNRVLATKLTEFNALALKLDSKWKAAKDRDGLALMKEAVFLERAFSIGVITKNERGALDECLTRRNTCGHPNSFSIGPPTVAHHIDTLIRNVFQKYT